MGFDRLLQSWWLLSISLLVPLNLQNWANAESQLPCYFIFGDSLSDNGNNNNLVTLAKVNYPPYGIDFPKGPTGRFSNGRNMQDIIVELLGFKDSMPPFVKAKGINILKGVNYASGSAGIRDESGRQLGARISLNEQIKNHGIIIKRITRILGNDSSTKKLLSRCIYSVQIGSNDYINNYFKPEFYNTSRQYTPEQFAAVLVQQYSQQIKILYDNGGRKFGLYGLGLLGCTPNAIATYGTNGSLCVDKLNNAATLFNDRLLPLVKELNTNLTDAKFSYLNPAPDPKLKGLFLNYFFSCFTVTNGSCCTAGGGGGELCIPHSKPCNDRNRFVFWDGVHPTDAFNEALAKSAYGTNSSTQAYPFNIQKLADLCTLFLPCSLPQLTFFLVPTFHLSHLFIFPLSSASLLIYLSSFVSSMANLASKCQPWLLLLVSFLLVSNIQNCSDAEPQVPCYFIFGDSLSDDGNNNNLATTAKVNYSPYGIDFPKGPTGRFTNGRTMQDIIVQLLDLQEFIPPFATSRGKEILKGVNYASGSAGILNETGEQLGDRISMNMQLSNHQIIISTIAEILGKCSASKLLSKCIYAVQIGSNDYINNYFMPEFYNTSRLYTPEQYAAYLIEQYAKQIKNLYNNGARMLALFGIGSIGCTPNAIAVYGTNGSACVEKLNNAAQLFNERLISLVDELNSNLTNAKFTYLNPSGTSFANSLGFTVTNASCCEIASDGELCVPDSDPCADRSQYVFWDAVHTTEAWNLVIATEAYSTQSSTEAYPLNIQNMAQLQSNNEGDTICQWSVLRENSRKTTKSDSV
ncbi:uncharacterized protein LOC111284368 [Durio zibethinus]|uniref:Uncharacterized protein LOC111284368 n=1 Tax=Durio zibethinus TaxID=66656 RepID=A0A6P5XLM8_DURZI|nr:uncharacterized protein LOC111284368 [Durio zibethinus]